MYKIVSILVKFTEKEIRKEVGKEEQEIREKVLLLANGMIDVHGYTKDEALKKAIKIAREWLANGGTYHKNNLKSTQ